MQFWHKFNMVWLVEAGMMPVQEYIYVSLLLKIILLN